MSQPQAKYSPFNGILLTHGVEPPFEAWRQPIHIWYFNPWTGAKRDPADVASDPHGLLIYDSAWGPLKAAEKQPGNALATQVAGTHYKDLKIQPIEYIHANGIPFAEGSVIKYVTRWRAKGGVQDLKKARHFLDLLIELETRGVEK